ncbi:extracellular solute-binding protein [Streptomonospora wellingtoniae]|uniref:Extracellular solute-binding protein n=1 Tax=Streptomonospora wellingtoniae TaxID=3075544 RepID=A0ABU2KR71_9ACTN|nr:extracellular solute-binding protein [Streptomonospora sp. DSM 45055]MDT0301780.1 extracellular solute-binding protein [Streptomonospora sp. DSM 45055]
MPHPPGGAEGPGRSRPGPGRPTRRQVLRGGMIGAGALALGASALGCGAPLSTGSDATRVRFWSLFQGGDGARVQTMLSDVHKQAPGLRVEPTTLAWGPPYYTKLAMASVGGRAPETAIMHMSRLPGYAPGGLLEPFDLDLLAEFQVTPDDFVPDLWRRGRYDGHSYAVPLDTHPFIAFYDTAMADEAGLLDSSGALRAFESDEDFIAASHELARASGANGVAFGHVNDDAQGWRLFWNLYRQTGADMRLPEGGPAEFDRDAALRAYTFLAGLFDGEHSAADLDYQTALAAFSDGRAGMLFTGEWELPYLAEAVENLGAAPFPTVFEEPGSYADSHSFVLPRQSASDPERVRAAHRFVALMVRNSLTWGKAGHVPAYVPVADSDAYRALEPQSDYAAAGETPVLDPEAWFAGAGSKFQSDMSETVRTALSGSGPEAAVEQLDRALASWVTRPNPSKGDM